MLAITNTLTVFAADKKNKGFKKLSKKIQKERDTDVEKIKEKVSDIFRDEQRRMKGYLDEHNKLIKKSDKPKKSRKKSIDFYEK
jgi:KaiC/GvpD/RAD55 family RecA-like ATPase|tara:strand:+ start:3687 stop:3938 length:252 start_codon:yes stop_codon:yes gene_type:complete